MDDALVRSQERWRGDEPAHGLTWGEMMTGDSFFEPVASELPFGPTCRIVEIGPGYGRLLETILRKQLLFGLYAGMEISRARVARLNADFRGANVIFFYGDAQADPLPPADILLCSSTFEHFYPDCSSVLTAVASSLRQNGRAAIDFIDPDQFGVGAAFDGAAFVRRYSVEELNALFAAASLRILASNRIILGRGHPGDIGRVQLLLTHS